MRIILRREQRWFSYIGSLFTRASWNGRLWNWLSHHKLPHTGMKQLTLMHNVMYINKITGPNFVDGTLFSRKTSLSYISCQLAAATSFVVRGLCTTAPAAPVPATPTTSWRWWWIVNCAFIILINYKLHLTYLFSFCVLNIQRIWSWPPIPTLTVPTTLVTFVIPTMLKVFKAFKMVWTLPTTY